MVCYCNILLCGNALPYASPTHDSQGRKGILLELIRHILPIFWTKGICILIDLPILVILIDNLVKARVTIFIHLIGNFIVHICHKGSYSRYFVGNTLLLWVQDL
jgi:hypothetical protein